MGNNAPMNSLGSAGQPENSEATALRVLRNLEANAHSPEALRDAILAVQELGEKVITEAKADAARLLRETAAVAEQLTDESLAAAAQVERDVATQWEQIVIEREKLEREIADWKAAVAARPTGGEGDVDQMRLRVAEEREQLARERELFDRRAAEWEAAVAAQRGSTPPGHLTHEEEQLRQRISEHRSRLVSMLQAALTELEPLDLPAPSQPGAGDMSSALTTRARNA
jgi:hypothetical protein